ncbi:hypothetical protein AB6A40_009361 [Gnathostoma spinigerum]|uniref:Uncharacterized protein n=1 Tax=Gnathostoma spinigerum TaxID=75299 RepID=A0ABD6F0I4_9BILA
MPATTAQNTGQALNSNYILPPPAKNNPGQAGARAHFVNANLAQTAANGVRINIATPQSLDSELEDLQSDGAVRKKKKVPVRKSKQSKRDMDAKERGIATFKRNLLWLIVLFAYSFIGGVTFSAIEGGKEKIERLQKYEKEKDIYEKRRIYQDQIVEKFQEINSDDSFTSVGLLEFNELSNISSGTHTKKELMRDILDWYEKKLGIEIREPVMEDTKWTIWGGIYYSASLYTTIGSSRVHSIRVEILALY